jgi:hypothetical protein
LELDVSLELGVWGLVFLDLWVIVFNPAHPAQIFVDSPPGAGILTH